MSDYLARLYGWPAGIGSAERAYRERLRVSMRGAISFARQRQEKRQREGKPSVAVTLTLDQAMDLLDRQDYRCALTRLRFYSLGSHSYGPSRPSIDRIKHAGPYSLGNVRDVLLSVNGLRGSGTDAEMIEVARALVKTARRLQSFHITGGRQ